MSLNAHNLRATGEYRKIQHESRAAAADSVELVAMLYDELETTLGVLVSLCKRRAPISLTEPAHRARMILIALDAGLDRAAGGELAESLSNIYISMRLRLERAIASGDHVALGEVGEGIKSLNSAWRSISRTHHRS